ncbi:MAG: class II glutamine amidotransferase [Pseudomonadota bacterium]|nr:class II glutamine amidotransferase [Pseudomonadota bacterium]
MCRLFGFRSSVVSRAHRSLIEAENALEEQARHHQDGWGIGYFHGGDAYVLKSQEGAAGNDSFRRASSRLASQTFVVHVRRATVGGVGPYNIHPFRHGRWLFAHNGTLHGFDRLRERLIKRIPGPMRDRVLGTTDTEMLFFYLLASLQDGGVASCGSGVTCGQRVGDALQEAMDDLYRATLAADVPPPIANFILTNGSVFVANRSGRDLFMATQKDHCRDFATCPAEKLCMRPTRPPPGEGDSRVNHLIVASERIGDEDRWESVPEGHMVVLSEDFRLDVRKPTPAWRPVETAPPPIELR